LILKPDLTPLRLEGRDEFVKKLAAPSDTLLALLSEESLRQMAAPVFRGLPGKAVKEGDRWKREERITFGPLGSWHSADRYIYAGTEDQLDIIKVESTLRYSAPSEVKSLPFSIRAADLKATKAHGTLRFDRNRGRIVESVHEQNLEGSLSIELGGQETQVELRQEQKTTVTTVDKNPLD
jgi:hypothetical protein